jgi:hypothetical protein
MNLAVGAILVEGPNRRTHFWKRTIQWLFHQNLVLIEQMVSDKNIFIGISHRVLAKNRKNGGWNLKKLFSSETTKPISTKLCWNEPWVVPFQKCVRHFRLPNKMAATTENIFFLIASHHFTIFSLATILVESRDHRTHLWKGTIQGLFH